MEWTVVIVLGALVSLGVAIVKPIVSLTKAITTLTVTVDNLQGDMENITRRNSDTHARLWKHSGEQDDKLADHECRISHLEGGAPTWKN